MVLLHGLDPDAGADQLFHRRGTDHIDKQDGENSGAVTVRLLATFHAGSRLIGRAAIVGRAAIGVAQAPGRGQQETARTRRERPLHCGLRIAD